LSKADLQQIIDLSIGGLEPKPAAMNLFVQLAKAQPFSDGNKRTALFAANGHLIKHNVGELLTVPVSDTDSSVASKFNEALARFYVYDDFYAIFDQLSGAFQPIGIPAAAVPDTAPPQGQGHLDEPLLATPPPLSWQRDTHQRQGMDF